MPLSIYSSLVLPVPAIKDKFFWMATILAAVYFMGGIGAGSLRTWDESVYANVSYEILKRGDWFNLHLYGNPWIEKPPLYMWGTAFFYKLFGITEFSVRITSAILGTACVSLIYLFGCRIKNRIVGLFAALTLTAIPHFLHFSKQGTLDVPMTFFLSLMLYLYWFGQENKRFLFWSAIAFGFSYFTKGYASLTGLGIIFVYAVISKKMATITNRFFISGLIVSFGVIFLFHLCQYVALGKDVAMEYFNLHVVNRTFKGIDNHVGNLDFYFHVIKNKALPWSILAMVSLAYTGFLAFRKRQNGPLFIVIWATIVFLFCSAVRTKLHWYIIPIYPALALSLGLLLEKICDRKERLNGAFFLIALTMTLQVFLSWSFDLNLNPQIKAAAALAKDLHRQGNAIYSYNVEHAGLFYLQDFASPWPAHKIESGQIVYVVSERIIDPAFFKQVKEHEMVYQAGDVAVYKLNI